MGCREAPPPRQQEVCICVGLGGLPYQAPLLGP